MAKSQRSAFRLVRARGGEPPPDLAKKSIVVASSRLLGWDGIVAEAGTSPASAFDDLAWAAHFIALNLDSKPLRIEAKGPHGFRSVVKPPGALWISAANAPFTHRNLGSTRWGAIEVSAEKVRRVLGRDIEPRSAYDLVDDALAGLVRALLLEVTTGGQGGPLVADGLAIAIAARLARHSGVDDRAIAPSGGIGNERLRRVKEAIEGNLADAVTTEYLAAIAGLSPAHFARAFKRATGETPHGFVMRRRVERARELLAGGSSIADAATRCGFSDQAHLSRLFKQRFGTTPGAFAGVVRGRRG